MHNPKYTHTTHKERESTMSNDSSPNLPAFPDSSASLPTRRTRAAKGEGTSSKADERKQSLYFRGEVLQTLKEEAARLDRSLSWVVSRCVSIALEEIKALPSMSDTDDA